MLLFVRHCADVSLFKIKMTLVSVYRGTVAGWFAVSLKDNEKDADRLIFYANRIHPNWHLKKEKA